MTSTCCNTSCSQNGTLRCGGCRSTSYCSITCQKTHWPTHKRTCAASAKHNCYVVRIELDLAASAYYSTATIVDHIEPLHLQQYDKESAEREEIKSRLKWSSIFDAGKFYDHAGADGWYYYVYGQWDGKARGMRKNEAISKACGSDVYGDAVVVRSGPEGRQIPENFTSTALGKTLTFYESNSTRKVFAEREKSRVSRKMGIDLSGVPSMHI
ncbi:MAG: hypothetical protein Q9178_002506 [Gyalolechia marmorata]